MKEPRSKEGKDWRDNFQAGPKGARKPAAGARKFEGADKKRPAGKSEYSGEGSRPAFKGGSARGTHTGEGSRPDAGTWEDGKPRFRPSAKLVESHRASKADGAAARPFVKRIGFHDKEKPKPTAYDQKRGSSTGARSEGGWKPKPSYAKSSDDDSPRSERPAFARGGARPYSRRGEGSSDFKKPYAPRGEGSSDTKKPYAPRTSGAGDWLKKKPFKPAFSKDDDGPREYKPRTSASGDWQKKKPFSRDEDGPREYKPRTSAAGDWKNKPSRPAFSDDKDAPREFKPRTSASGDWQKKKPFKPAFSRDEDGPREYKPGTSASGDWQKKKPFSRDEDGPREYKPRSSAAGDWKKKPARPAFSKDNDGPRESYKPRTSAAGDWKKKPARPSFGSSEADRPGYKAREEREYELTPDSELANPQEATATREPKKDWRKKKPDSVGDRRAAYLAEQAKANPKNYAGLQRLIASFKDTRSLQLRHTWIYDNMVEVEPEGGLELNGKAVAVIDDAGKFLGSAIYNTHSKIRGRIFSLHAQEFSPEYVRSAMDSAIARRLQLFAADDSCRLIFGDSDGIPGLVVDKIGTVLVVQLLTLASDRHGDVIVEQLQSSLSPTGIVVRRDIAVRTKEGLPLIEPEIIGEVPNPVPVEQDGFTVFADLVGGQKTGVFLDQRFNRQLMKPWCKDARVLDLYCYIGAWSFTAALAGAREVIGVDSSAPATALATQGATANEMPQVTFETSDVFEYFDELPAEEMFNVVVADPPAFAKTRTQVKDALKAYLSLNYRCMKRLEIGGILVTCSCSQHVGADEFQSMLENAAHNARMQFHIVHRTGQPPDHPVLLGFPESEYLKCFVLQRVE